MTPSELLTAYSGYDDSIARNASDMGVEPIALLIAVNRKWPMSSIRQKILMTKIEAAYFRRQQKFPFGCKAPEAANGKIKSGAISFRMGNEIKFEKVDWLWPNRFPLGMVSLVAGFPDQGKSQVLCSIAATITTGGVWPDCFEPADQGAVIIWGAEDVAESVLAPRLKAAGADMSQIALPDSMVMGMVEGKKQPRVLNLQADIKEIERMIELLASKGRHVKAILFDPLNAYFGSGVDSHNAAEMRGLLTPLSEWCANKKIAVIGIMHFNKGGNSHTLYRVTDSASITAVCRAVWFTHFDEDADKYFLLPGKKNIGTKAKGLEYRIEAVKISDSIDAPRIVWGLETKLRASQAFGGGARGRPKGSDDTFQEASAIIEKLMGDGDQIDADAAKAAAKEHGISIMTLHRARKSLGLRVDQSGFGDAKVSVWRRWKPDEFMGDDDQDAPDFG